MPLPHHGGGEQLHFGAGEVALVLLGSDPSLVERGGWCGVVQPSCPGLHLTEGAGLCCFQLVSQTLSGLRPGLQVCPFSS